MTLRLAAFFEERIRTIISEYKTAVKSSDRLRRSQRFRKKMTQQDPPSATARLVVEWISRVRVCDPSTVWTVQSRGLRTFPLRVTYINVEGAGPLTRNDVYNVNDRVLELDKSV